MLSDYIERIYMACMANYENLFILDGALYKGVEGHKRLAREIGYALNDFPYDEAMSILQSSYSGIYVRACLLKPILDAKEWNEEISAMWLANAKFR